MPRTKGWSEFMALATRQLDATLRANPHLREITTPRGGWIKSIRTALGMTAAQLAKRAQIKPQSVLDLERREDAGTITVATLQKAARALNCEVKIVFLPQLSFDEMLRNQAMMKARDERNRVVHSMHLEAQDDGLQYALKLEKLTNSWLTTRRARLWD